MACGRAVISSADGGARELIQEGEDALSHPPGDDAALAERLLEVTKSLELRLRLGRAARTTAERRFDRARLADQILPLYSRLRGLPAPQRNAELAAAG
jgi:glycosyltransferase involved in cell wall biosynthesis